MGRGTRLSQVEDLVSVFKTEPDNGKAFPVIHTDEQKLQT